MKIFLLIAVFSLIGSPLGGAHLHLSDVEGFAGLHSVHVHEAEHHAEESDSSIAEQLTQSIQILVLVVAVSLLATIWFAGLMSPPNADYLAPVPRMVFLENVRLRAPPFIR